jgi:D-serine deaminase-like pyridoxal phosphate-dependent protein
MGGALLSLLPLLFVHDLYVSLACLSLGFFFAELCIGPMWAIPMDIAPDHSGTASGMMNTGSALAAIISPVASGLLIDMTGNWEVPFVGSMVLMGVGVLLSFRMKPEHRFQIAPPHWQVGDPLARVGTPALLIDLQAFDDNLRQMAELAQRHGVALRPHAKAHKSTAIALRQMAQGAVGICCQKLSEAYPFAAAGIRSIHISNEFVGEDKLTMAMDLAGRVDLSVCVDHIAQVNALGLATQRTGVHLAVFPEVDIGQGRCGVADAKALMALVDGIARHGHLRWGGLQAFHGGLQHIPDWAERRQATARATERVAQFVQFLEARGVRCPVVTGGGTGTAEFDVASGVYTEIQPGSYIFLDGHYGANAWREGQPPRHGLFIVSTIMSTARPGRAVCDLGLKGVAVDSGLPRLWSQDPRSALRYVAANDEHGVLELPPGLDEDLLGERVLLVPGHCDPTVNLYAQYTGIRDGQVACLWDIEARGLSQ